MANNKNFRIKKGLTIEGYGEAIDSAGTWSGVAIAYADLSGTPTNLSSFTNDTNYLDSNTVTGVIDSSYVQSNQTTYSTADFPDSAGVSAIITTDVTKAFVDALGINATSLNGWGTVTTGDRWGGIPVIGNDGVMEIGRYIDFHESDSAVTDYSVRLNSNNGALQTSADFSFPDNVKATFGDSNDLQIYHDGSTSYIDDAGTGNLEILAANAVIKGKTSGQWAFAAVDGGATTLYHLGAAKLDTTATGIDVTGNVNIDGGDVLFEGTSFTSTLTYTEPTQANTLTLPDSSGTIALLSDIADQYISNTYVYTASASQTTFTGADDNAATLSYTVGNIQVFLNGVNLIDTVDYTATNSTSVVLTTAAAANDVLVVNAFNAAVNDVTNADLLDSQEGTYYLNYNNFTNTPTIPTEASVSEYRSKTASKYITPQVAFNAMEQIQLTDSTSIGVDLSSGFNFKVTLSGSNAATFNFTNGYAGQTGRIRIDYGDSSNTATFQSEGGTGTVYNSPTLSTDSAALDIIYYDCIDSNEIYLTANLGVT